MSSIENIHRIIQSRGALRPADPQYLSLTGDHAAEGGCGVIGIACSEKIPGRHLLQALDQMRNRGNGKGGGIAAVGLQPEEFGVTQEILDQDYLIVVAYLDPASRKEVEQEFIFPIFEVDHIRQQPQLENFRSLDRLEVQPPQVYQYFVRVKEDVFYEFRLDNGLAHLDRRGIEDEIVYQNTYQLNRTFYASTGETRAFVLSHGKNLLVLKMVGYGDDVVRYYQLEDSHAHIWIGHHRYPTKGRVWHPGGAHPFVGLNEALVHNGDFANYASITEYLSQRNIYPLFLTDTEVSVQVFDLLHRTYGYPLEYVIEALAPTTERDFTMLPLEKQRIYEMIQITHMHCSPDGPWFFLIAQSEEEAGSPVYRLTCITDTSMLRPQVFAWQQTSEDGPAIGFAASEKQAIDAALGSLSEEDPRFWSRADRYWNARGGSHTDGGAFIFSAHPNQSGSAFLTCTDKFGRPVEVEISTPPYLPRETDFRITNVDRLPSSNDDIVTFSGTRNGRTHATAMVAKTKDRTVPQTNGKSVFMGIIALNEMLDIGSKSAISANGSGRELDHYSKVTSLFTHFKESVAYWTYEDVLNFLHALERFAVDDGGRKVAIETLTLLMDHRYATGNLRRSSLLSLYDQSLERLVDAIRDNPTNWFAYVSVDHAAPSDVQPEQRIVIDARGFDPEGPHSLAMEITGLYKKGYRNFLVGHARGHRFIANGLGIKTQGIRLDVYGASGDYLASGIDGLEIYVHGNAQDQLAQIMKAGKLVVYGDVGQTFMYGAKGGEAYVLGNAAGRPLINAVGKPRVVINGTCLDYLAESFMAGNPHDGGGFVILNGIYFTNTGKIDELDTPYPGGNLFSLASGGAIFVRDPFRKITADQLNGGEFFPFEARDWDLIKPYLQENEKLFGISVERLLEVDGQSCRPDKVYRKIAPTNIRALQAEEAWVRNSNRK